MHKLGFSFDDYNCIGFDLDHTLVRYNLKNLIELEYYALVNYLVHKKKYPGDVLLQAVDRSFLQKGLIIDSKLGNVLKIGQDGGIVLVCHGTKMLKDKEILKYYPYKRLDFIDRFISNPLDFWNTSSYVEKMRIPLDYFDVITTLVYARAVDTVEKHASCADIQIIWNDITEALLQMFIVDNYYENIGGFYPEFKNNPSLYYSGYNKSLVEWIKKLKLSGKQLFLISGAYSELAQKIADSTLGKNWNKYFDITIFNAKKPLFFYYNNDFHQLKKHEEQHPIPEDQLRKNEIYSQGNWNGIQKFLIKHSNTPKPKFIYIGDNLLLDIYTPKVTSKIDTLYVCEELEGENICGFDGKNSDFYLKSNLWGSYFFEEDNRKTLSYWGYLMQTYSTYFVPSLNYVAKYPVGYKFGPLKCKINSYI